jgi:radical SAM protein with 4Fe4S-binding SPASM domain
MNLFYDTCQFLRTISWAKLWNGFLLRLSYVISLASGRFIRWGKPEFLSVEPTNLCNLKCPECPSGNNAMQRPRLFLSEKNYQDLIDKTKKQLAFLQLYFQGEPFLHPKIYDFIAYATRNNIYTATSTNGQFLTYENCLKIVDSGLHRLVVSMDGTTQETYEKYRVGGSLDLVLKGLGFLQQAKKIRGRHTPHIIVQFVVFKTNEHQIPELKTWAKGLPGITLQLKSAQLEPFAEGHELMPTNTKYLRYTKTTSGVYVLKRKNNFKCQRVWKGAVVAANNQLLPCCFDKDADHSLGNLSADTLNKVWKAPETLQFIHKVWQHHASIEMCKNCTEGIKKT